MKIGVVLHHKYFNGVVESKLSKKYQDVSLRYFSYFGMYGTGIFGMIAKGPDIVNDYDWRNTDLLIDHSLNNNVQIHFNTVISGSLSTYPDWYKELSPEKKLSALEFHVRAVLNRYKGKVDFFKLVNEVTREPVDNFLGTELDKVELISRIFKWAVDEYPGGRYMLNEYGSLIKNEVREPFLDLVKKIKGLGGRIDIIGEQGHSGYFPRPFYLPTDKQISETLDEIYSRTNLPLMITEFDLGPKNGDYVGGSIDPTLPVTCDNVSYRSWYEYQGYAYSHFMEMCEKKVFVEGFYYWSFVDDPSIKWERNGCGLFNEDIEVKRVMESLLSRLEKQRPKA